MFLCVIFITFYKAYSGGLKCFEGGLLLFSNVVSAVSTDMSETLGVMLTSVCGVFDENMYPLSQGSGGTGRIDALIGISLQVLRGTRLENAPFLRPFKPGWHVF